MKVSADVTRVAFAAAVAMVAWAMAAPGWWRPVEDPDLWWLIWAGDQGLPDANGFSWTAPDHPWTLHEPVVALVYSAVGLEAVGAVRGMVLTVLTVLMVLLAWRPDRAWSTVLGLVWALPLVSLAFSERAMAWGLLFAAAQALAHARGRHGVAAACVGGWAWIHGSFPVGVLVAFIASPRHGVLALLFTLPRADVWMLSVQYLLGGGTSALLRGHIAEWGWLVPDSVPQAARLACVVLVIGLARRRPWLVLLLVPLALRHWRMCSLLGIFLLAPFVDALRTPSRRCANPLPLMLAALLPVAALSNPTVVEAGVTPSAGALYNDLTLGGWLGYRGFRPFWDPRNDCYPPEVYADGLRVAYQHDMSVLDRRGVVQILTRDDELVEVAQEHGFWIQERGDGLTRMVRR